MKKYIRIAVVLFVFGIAPTITNAHSAVVFRDSIAAIVNDLFNIDDSSLASAVDAYDSSLAATDTVTVAQRAPTASNPLIIAYNDQHNDVNTSADLHGVVYYNSDEDLKVTYDDVWTGVKETFKAMVTYQR